MRGACNVCMGSCAALQHPAGSSRHGTALMSAASSQPGLHVCTGRLQACMPAFMHACAGLHSLSARPGCPLRPLTPLPACTAQPPNDTHTQMGRVSWPAGAGCALAPARSHPPSAMAGAGAGSAWAAGVLSVMRVTFIHVCSARHRPPP